MCWEISQKQLQQHRLHRTPLKLMICAVDNRTKSKEQVGYLLLDLRTAQQRPDKGHWIRLLNVSYPRLKPEIFVILTQESATATDSVPPSPLIQPDHSVPQVHTQARLPGIALDPKHGYFVQFILANPNSSFLKIHLQITTKIYSYSRVNRVNNFFQNFHNL